MFRNRLFGLRFGGNISLSPKINSLCFHDDRFPPWSPFGPIRRVNNVSFAHKPWKTNDQTNLHDDFFPLFVQFQIIKVNKLKVCHSLTITPRCSICHLNATILSELLQTGLQRAAEKRSAVDVRVWTTLRRAPHTDNKQFISQPEKLCWKRESHPAIIRGETEVKWERVSRKKEASGVRGNRFY